MTAEDAANRPDRSWCRLCGRLIAWTRTADGRRKPFDVLPGGGLGKSHFLTCKPYREQCAERDRARKAARVRARAADQERRQGRLF